MMPPTILASDRAWSEGASSFTFASHEKGPNPHALISEPDDRLSAIGPKFGASGTAHHRGAIMKRVKETSFLNSPLFPRSLWSGPVITQTGDR
jgi:hypothetical protein